MRSPYVPVPVLGLAALSGTGKTTLLRQLLPLLRARGLAVGLIKRAHHTFDIDLPGKDSYELRKAGAAQVLVGSDNRWALMVENERPVEPDLDDLVAKLHRATLDLVIVEGFKLAPIPKIEIHRPSLGQPLLAGNDPWIVAVATDEPQRLRVDIPLFDLERPGEIAQFICGGQSGAAGAGLGGDAPVRPAWDGVRSRSGAT
jgi:molybdopterin-guanine dinucleotide biosynthesis adapter protein